MIETELQFNTKLEQAELLRQLSERWNVNYIPEVTGDEYLWEPTENFSYLAYFPEHLSYPAAGTPENYYLRYYWIMVCSKRFEKKLGEDLWQLETEALDELDRQGLTANTAMLEFLHNAAEKEKE